VCAAVGAIGGTVRALLDATHGDDDQISVQRLLALVRHRVGVAAVEKEEVLLGSSALFRLGEEAQRREFRDDHDLFGQDDGFAMRSE
jgi:hypothetical protein